MRGAVGGTGYIIWLTKIKEPEEAVDDALVCVWQRIVALITSWDAELKIITINHIVMIIDY